MCVPTLALRAVDCEEEACWTVVVEPENSHFPALLRSLLRALFRLGTLPGSRKPTTQVQQGRQQTLRAYDTPCVKAQPARLLAVAGAGTELGAAVELVATNLAVENSRLTLVLGRVGLAELLEHFDLRLVVVHAVLLGVADLAEETRAHGELLLLGVAADRARVRVAAEDGVVVVVRGRLDGSGVDEHRVKLQGGNEWERDETGSRKKEVDRKKKCEGERTMPERKMITEPAKMAKFLNRSHATLRFSGVSGGEKGEQGYREWVRGVEGSSAWLYTREL